MTEIFHKANMPFYRFGEIIYLNRIKAEKLKAFVQDPFSSSHKELPASICNKIVETVENHPFYLQQFATLIGSLKKYVKNRQLSLS